MTDDFRARVYGQMADAFERDPIGPDGSGRAVVVNGRGWKLHKRFNPQAEYVSVTTLQGKWVELTRIQANVLDLARSKVDKGTTTMREMAQELGVAPSTVYRALVRLAAFGLIGYLTGRGRWNRTVIFSRGKNDGLDRFQKVAKEKIRQWSDATAARFARLRATVASRFTWKEMEDHGLQEHFVSPMVATLRQPWTPEELRDAGII